MTQHWAATFPYGNEGLAGADMMTAHTTIDPETITRRETADIPPYRVLLHNDDQNTMDHVVESLIRVFGFDRARSERIMREAHEQGTALCTIEPLEQAELHRDRLRSFSLIATIEPA